MSPASVQHCSVTRSAISSIAIVTSPPGATPTPVRAPGSPSEGATASRTRAARSRARRVIAGSGGPIIRPIARLSPGGYQRALVQLEVLTGQSGHRELLGARATFGHESVAQRRIVEHAAQ